MGAGVVQKVAVEIVSSGVAARIAGQIHHCSPLLCLARIWLEKSGDQEEL
jgi:hypothetical protein